MLLEWLVQGRKKPATKKQRERERNHFCGVIAKHREVFIRMWATFKVVARTRKGKRGMHRRSNEKVERIAKDTRYRNDANE